LANVSDAISTCLKVLREDGEWTPNLSPIEIIEQPIENFLRVPVAS
jgi:hypothetical protein